MAVSARVSIVIVNHNGTDIIIDCLRSIYTHLKHVPYEVIVIDNASTDSSPEQICQQFPKVTLLPQIKNLGFGAANNIGVSQAKGEFVFFLNSDTILTANVLPTLLTKLTKPESRAKVGIVGPQLLNLDGSFQLSVSKEISLLGEYQTLQQVKQYRNLTTRSTLAQLYSHNQYVDIVVGAAMMMPRSLFEYIGGFDEAFFMYLEESDLCKRVRALGYTILYTPDVSLIHIGGYSVAKVAGPMANAYRRSQRYYYQKHRPIWEQWLLNTYLKIKEWRS